MRASASASASASATSASASSNPLSGGSASGSVVVGSANFPEDELLAEVYVLALQAKGVKVTSKFNIGAREVYYPQLSKGAIAIIPEYNGALLTSVDPSAPRRRPPRSTPRWPRSCRRRWRILNPATAQDTTR